MLNKFKPHTITINNVPHIQMHEYNECKVVQNTSNNFNRKRSTGMHLIYAEKAFDSIIKIKSLICKNIKLPTLPH